MSEKMTENMVIALRKIGYGVSLCMCSYYADDDAARLDMRSVNALIRRGYAAFSGTTIGGVCIGSRLDLTPRGVEIFEEVRRC